ncbi:MAG: hypothetical protein ABIQ01_01210 [Pseudolysinimonas sp.]
MGLFSKRATSDPGDESRPRYTALVVSADAPPQSAPSHGRDSTGSIQVLVDTPDGAPRKLAATFTYADDRWIAAGMDAPVMLDPANPDTFEVDWAAVPSMKQQAEANHPALADPFATSRRIAEALGISPSEKTAAQYERFQKAVAEAGTKPAPAGRLRAVAMIATVRGRYAMSGGDNFQATRSSVTLTRDSAAVLSVAIPGEQPYAVYLPKFKEPASRLAVPGEPMPALVSATDRQDVEIIWSEMAGLGDQIAARIADSASGNDQMFAAMNHEVETATAQAASTAAPMAGMGTGMGMSGDARQVMVDNLKRSLMSIPDPAMRQQVINQYRAMGIDMTPEELGL